jgi:myo-inositol-1(or 4)-monophosphatase
MDIETIKKTGMSAAHKGAEALRLHFEKITRVNKKGRIDLVTEADTASEKIIIKTIRAAFPDHAILAEESGMNDGTPEYQWYIDPLDGTTNFANGLNLFCVSIAFAAKEEVVFGIVLSPFTDELFTAVKGGGALRNSRPIRVSNAKTVTDSLLATGFPYDFKNDGPIIRRFSNCLRQAQGIRRLGSAALDLCYVACGRFAGYWEQHLHPWDTAAGFLIAKEAGGLVTDYSNRAFTVDKKEIVATNGNIHKEMLALLSLEDKI